MISDFWVKKLLKPGLRILTVSKFDEKSYPTSFLQLTVTDYWWLSLNFTNKRFLGLNLLISDLGAQILLISDVRGTPLRPSDKLPLTTNPHLWSKLISPRM